MFYRSRPVNFTVFILIIITISEGDNFYTSGSTISGAATRGTHIQRIVGGKIADINAFPATACLILKTPDGDDFRGGAVIVGDRWVLTAAHCMTFIKQSDIQNNDAFVRSNTGSWTQDYSDHMIVKSYVHELYNNNITDYDVALLRVKEPFKGLYERPIKYAQENYKYEDKSSAAVLGWGTTDVTATEPFVVRKLRYVYITIMNFQSCKAKYKTAHEIVTERMVCAGAPGRDACIFDSGGPLYQNNTLIGLVSWGSNRCADKILPGVYTKVSMFHQWIENKINNKNV